VNMKKNFLGAIILGGTVGLATSPGWTQESPGETRQPYPEQTRPGEQEGIPGMHGGGTQELSKKDMQAVQQVLKEKGYDVSVDGTANNSTRAAIRKFQENEGLVVTGTAFPNQLRNEFLASTALPFDQHREVGGRHSLHLCAKGLHHGRRAYEGACTVQRLASKQCAHSCNFEHEATQMRQCNERVEIRLVERPVRIARCLEDGLHTGIGCRYAEHDRVRGPRRRDETCLITGPDFTQPNHAQIEELSDLLLEGGFEIVVGCVPNERSPERLEHWSEPRDTDFCPRPWVAPCPGHDCVRLTHVDLHTSASTRPPFSPVRLTKCDATAEIKP